jgi:hypothetical protein
MNEDKFLMWKLGLSAIHFDGKVTDEETNWFNNKIKQLDKNKILGFSDEQIEELKSVLKKPVDNFLDEFKKISKPADASFVLHILTMIANVDRDYSPEEREKYEVLKRACLEGVDQSAITQKVNPDKFEKETVFEKILDEFTEL